MFQLTLTKPSKNRNAENTAKRGVRSLKDVEIVKAYIIYVDDTVYAINGTAQYLLSSKDLDPNGRKYYWTIDTRGNLTKVILLEPLNTVNKKNKYRYKNGANVEGYIKVNRFYVTKVVKQ